MQTELNITKQEKVDTYIQETLHWNATLEVTRSRLSPGFWLKNFSSLHWRVRSQLKERLDRGFVPNWFTKGKTALLQKDKSKGNIASNYRPITFLPLM